MDVISYIYEFLHDPRKNRWPQPVVDYLLTLAEADITSKVNTFLKARDIQRELAQLKQLGTTDKCFAVGLINGVSVYTLPEDFLRVRSVLYEDCFVPHKIPSCDTDLEACDDCKEMDPHKVIRSYNTSGLPKGKIMFSPPPNEWLECEIKIKEEIKRTIGVDCEPEPECEPEIRHTRVEVLNEESLLGWGFLNITPKRSITEIRDECEVIPPKPVVPVIPIVPEVVKCPEVKRTHLTFGELQVTYEASNVLEFDKNDAEVLSNLLADDQLKKFFVCGHLLRDDKDSNSRSLGAEELQLFEQRIVTLLGKYAELYDKDNVLEIASSNDGYVNTSVNTSVIDKDAVTLREELLNLERKNASLGLEKVELGSKEIDLAAEKIEVGYKEIEVRSEELDVRYEDVAEDKATIEDRKCRKAKYDILGVR